MLPAQVPHAHSAWLQMTTVVDGRRFAPDAPASSLLEALTGSGAGSLRDADGLEYVGPQLVPAGIFTLVSPPQGTTQPGVGICKGVWQLAALGSQHACLAAQCMGRHAHRAQRTSGAWCANVPIAALVYFLQLC
jgi:hypothetical protein